MSPPVGDLAVRVPPLSLDDPVAKAAEALRVAPTRMVPLAQDGRLIGLLHPADLAEVLDGAADVVAQMPVAAVRPRACLALPSSTRAAEALAHLRRQGLDAAPVVDDAGRYVGMVGIGELISALCGRIRPRTIGGLATPFGVHLTTGAVRGGVGDLALISTGLFIAGLSLLALTLTDFIVRPGGLLDQWPALRSVLPGRISLNALVQIITLVAFMVLFRLSWVAGYHAAEHQVVHTIEQGEELLPAVVRTKPRVHPRCGTNLVVGLMLLIQVYDFHLRHSLPAGSLSLIAGLGFVFFSWRRLGAVAQQYITTRPATQEQIESGIRAGKELLARHQAALGDTASLGRRIWNMGLVQVFIGFYLPWLVVEIVARWWPIPLPGIW
ncbi:MAG: DUF1385 domain-containing protein [Armatimonadetes bacterium]|nr:DUF1385 domain-containing protein [Armatimonadota bacterium]